MIQADLILRDGFRDDVGPVRTSLPPGVFLADWKIGPEELKRKGDKLDTLLILDVPEDLFAKYKYADSHYDGRVSIIPADILNLHAGAAIHEHLLDEATEEQLLESSDRAEESGDLQHAEWIRKSLEFLRKHGRLAAAD
jgi:hypothetical protein